MMVYVAVVSREKEISRPRMLMKMTGFSCCSGAIIAQGGTTSSTAQTIDIEREYREFNLYRRDWLDTFGRLDLSSTWPCNYSQWWNSCEYSSCHYYGVTYVYGGGGGGLPTLMTQKESKKQKTRNRNLCVVVPLSSMWLHGNARMNELFFKCVMIRSRSIVLPF